jgi:hypothetical protein
MHENPMCRECEGRMTLLGSWAATSYVAPGGELPGQEITARHFLCEACRIPLRVEYCPTHQRRLVVPPLGADRTQRRPYQCTEQGCTYERPREQAPLLLL